MLFQLPKLDLNLKYKNNHPKPPLLLSSHITSLSTQRHLRHALLWIFQHPLYSPPSRTSEQQNIQIKLATFYFNHVKSISICARSFLYLTYLVLNLVLELVAAVEIKLKLKILQAEHRQVQVSVRIYENKDLDCCRGLFRCLPLLLKCVFLILVRYEIFLLRGKLSSHFMTSRSTVSVNRKTSTTSLDLYFVVFAG